MFYGYIDESGDNKTQLRTLSCLAGHWSYLFWFENDWTKILEKKNRQLKAEGRQELSRFHATYWSTKREEFTGWSDDEKIAFIDEFIALFLRYPVAVSSETLNKKDLIEVFPEAMDRVEELAHSLLLIFIVLFFDSKVLGDKRYLTDRIAFIHDESPYRSVLRDTFEGLKNDLGVKNRDRLVSIKAKTWREEILLQAADLIAYENFKVIERQSAGFDMRKPMKRILLSSNFGGRNAFLTKAALQEFRDKADEPTLKLVFENARIIRPSKPNVNAG
ncbi:MAG: DUF3800 domain-containing protein [Candidatus Acidiferrales bacterium]